MTFWDKFMNWIGSVLNLGAAPKKETPKPSYPKGVELAADYLARDPQNKFGSPRYIAEINYAMKSSEKRLAIWDREKNTVNYHKVSHGSGTGTKPHNGHCVEFSNVDGSHMTCLGAFKTAETYNGGNGYSMRLDGLDPTNSNARKRLIVMHGSDYVNDSNSSICGRSWGCPSVDYKILRSLIDRLKGGSLLLAHYNGHFEYTKKAPIAPPSGSLKTAFPNQAWADHALKFVKASKLPAAKVADSWFKNTPENWVHLMAAMCKFESNFKPTATYKENFKNGKGEFVISTGLFQLSYESVGGYGYKVTTEQLKEPFLNIEIAVEIMEKWVVNDGCISSPENKGPARFWSTLRGTGKFNEVKKLYGQWSN